METHNGSGWDVQAEMSYNGLGQRLSMNAAGVIAYYVMDGNRPLTAETSGNVTTFLYGLGAIAEQTTAWNYILPDGSHTPRQLTDSNGEITLSTRYTPWGDTLERNGTGNFVFGYPSIALRAGFGALMDEVTGLLYVGNGQYYDPSTGRFLTRNANPNSPNPYLPFDPTGLLLGPLGLLVVFYAGRRNKKSAPYVVLLIVLVALPMSVSLACRFGGSAPAPSPTPTQPPATGTSTPGEINGGNAPSDPGAPSPQPTPCPTPTPTALTPPPSNPTEGQMIEYIKSFGITLSGNWTGLLLANLWEALFTHIGYLNLKSWLNGRPATLVWGGERDCGGRDACYGGNTPGDTVTFKATGMVNPVVNILHELGHLVDNLWDDYFTGNLERTTFYDERGNALAGWDGGKYVSLPSDSSSALDVRKLALKSSTFGGQDAWQQRGGTRHWEDWADIFSNSMIRNINQTTDLGNQIDSFFIKMKTHAMGG